MALSDYQALVSALVRDDSSIITPTDTDLAIDLAVKRYSTDRPQYKVEDVSAIAVGSHSLNLPTSWEADFSQLSALEYPIGQWPASMPDAEHYELYQSPAGIEVRVNFFAESEPVRLTYTISHALSIADDTIPTGHREAVACWAAAFLCDQLANYYAGESDSTLSAQHVDNRSKSKDFSFRSQTLRARYLSELGVDEKRSAPAGVVVDMDMKNSQGQNRLTHSNRFR